MLEPYERLDRNSRLIRNFWEISHTMRRISEGKGSQKRILMILRDNRNITQRELTEHLGIQPGSVSEVIGKLEAAGLILRTPSPTDRRTADLSLTETGEAAAGEAYAKREQRHQEMFACLSEEEEQTLLGLLEKINLSWRRQYRTHGPQGISEDGGEEREPPAGTNAEKTICGNT